MAAWGLALWGLAVGLLLFACASRMLDAARCALVPGLLWLNCRLAPMQHAPTWHTHSPINPMAPLAMQVAAAVGAARVFCSRRYEPQMASADARVADALAAAGFEVRRARLAAGCEPVLLRSAAPGAGWRHEMRQASRAAPRLALARRALLRPHAGRTPTRPCATGRRSPFAWALAGGRRGHAARPSPSPHSLPARPPARPPAGAQLPRAAAPRAPDGVHRHEQVAGGPLWHAHALPQGGAPLLVAQ